MKLRIIWNGMEWNVIIYLKWCSLHLLQRKVHLLLLFVGKGKGSGCDLFEKRWDTTDSLNTATYALSFVVWRGLDLLLHVLCQTWRKCTKAIWFPFTTRQPFPWRSPPTNKALLRAYSPLVAHNKALLNPDFWGVRWGGRFAFHLHPSLLQWLRYERLPPLASDNAQWL